MLLLSKFLMVTIASFNLWFSPDIDWTVPQTSVIIDAGHGGIDGGATYGGILEKDINMSVANKLYRILNENGIDAVLNRVGDYALSEENKWSKGRSRHGRDLSQRRGLTEEIDSKILVSLHVNASGKKTSRGPIVLHQKNGESLMLAHFIQTALNKQQQTAFLPREGNPFYLLKTVKIPAVIVEMGFISNDQDRQMLTTEAGQEAVANAIALGILQYCWTTY